jgi:hypothetical protein
MASCEQIHRFKWHFVDTPVTQIESVQKRPKIAPDHRKPDQEIIGDLNRKLQADLRDRMRNPGAPQCPDECDMLWPDRKLSDTVSSRDVHSIWEEQFELLDADGNVIEGTARYMAKGKAKVQVIEYERRCEKKIGDDPKDFYMASYNPDKPSISVAAYNNLADLWKALPKSDREGLNFVKGGKKA